MSCPYETLTCTCVRCKCRSQPALPQSDMMQPLGNHLSLLLNPSMMGSVVSQNFFYKENVKMKIKLNPMFEEARGKLGDLVFREVRGETVASRKPSMSGEPTVDQAAHRERFKLAAAYGKSVMADNNMPALFE